MTARDQIKGTETNMASVRERFGGVATPAALVGMFAALGVLVFLGSLIAAGAGNLAYQLNAFDLEGNVEELAWAGVITATLVVFVSFLVGGWAAGRMARYDGGINGLAAGLWLVVLVAIFAALGAWVGQEYNAFQMAGLPDWFTQFRGDDRTTIGVVAAILALVAVFVGGYLGGRFGEMFHRRVDAALTDTRSARPGGEV